MIGLEWKRGLPYDPARGIPVVAFTGINGAGKTLLAVTSAIADMRAGRPVYSTVPIRYVTPEGEVLESIPLVSLLQLAALQDCTVLLDDIAVMFSSTTATSSLPAEIEVFFHTARHRRVTVRWTAPDWMRAQTLVRGATQACVNVVPLLRDTLAGDFWPTPRLVALGVADTTIGKKDATPSVVSRRAVRVPTRLAGWGAYDSEAPTPLLGVRSSRGVCLACYGTIPAPRHSRERHEQLGLAWTD